MATSLLPQSPARIVVPATLQVGSGKQFRADCLNLDIEPRWRPDVMFDLEQPLPADGQLLVQTERFGEIVLGEHCFDEIIAQDVLEHLRNLTTAMTTMLHWLRPGGVLKVAVPYDLSLGAWCDPTHVRGFNERSFDYYTQWSWYLGWRDYHFALQKLDVIVSEYGRELQAAGRSAMEILRTPRAVDQLYVELRKQPLDAATRQATEFFLERSLPGRAGS